ncbi:hypothetical protein ADK74_21945 [Streptomyces decoyicus]|nr:hypothetical protein ADK74_21945 [Streptomyces decoyicus]
MCADKGERRNAFLLGLLMKPWVTGIPALCRDVRFIGRGRASRRGGRLLRSVVRREARWRRGVFHGLQQDG